MVSLGLAGIVIGLVCGRRFTVFALLPVEFTALCVAVWFTLVGHTNVLAALLGFCSFSIASQTSYAVAFALPAILRGRTGRNA